MFMPLLKQLFGNEIRAQDASLVAKDLSSASKFLYMDNGRFITMGSTFD